MEKVAFFDIDGTLIRDRSSERIFFRYLIERRIVTFKDLMRYAAIFFKNLFTFKGLCVRKNKFYLKGKDYGMIVSAAEACFNERISRYISKDALIEIEHLQLDGCKVILLSGTLDPIMECFKRYCGADDGIATALKRINGAITGEIGGIYAYNKGKAEIVERLARERQIDLPGSYGYANKYTDVKFMRMVGIPVAVNASLFLRRHARKNRWKIVEF